jgi:hypothetical protein
MKREYLSKIRKKVSRGVALNTMKKPPEESGGFKV